MGKKQIKCIICGGNVIYDEITQNLTCSVCKAHHSSDIFKSQKIKGTRFRITKIRILVAIMGALYLLWVLYRRWGFY